MQTFKPIPSRSPSAKVVGVELSTGNDDDVSISLDIVASHSRMGLGLVEGIDTHVAHQLMWQVTCALFGADHAKTPTPGHLAEAVERHCVVIDTALDLGVVHLPPVMRLLQVLATWSEGEIKHLLQCAEDMEARWAVQQ